MEAHAHVVARGDVLNVGFGLGLVDEVRARGGRARRRSRGAGRAARPGRQRKLCESASLLAGRAWRVTCGTLLCALVGREAARIQ